MRQQINSHRRISFEKDMETVNQYENEVYRKSKHIHIKATDSARTLVCTHPTDNKFPYWKCVLRYCESCPKLATPTE